MRITVADDLDDIEWHPPRCIEKGCVFPAEREGRCLHHDRQLREPKLYTSHQPTSLVVAHAKYGVRCSEPDWRSHDRRRLAAEREAFLED